MTTTCWQIHLLKAINVAINIRKRVVVEFLKIIKIKYIIEKERERERKAKFPMYLF